MKKYVFIILLLSGCISFLYAQTAGEPKSFFSLSNFNFWTLLPLLFFCLLFVLLIKLDGRLRKSKKEIINSLSSGDREVEKKNVSIFTKKDIDRIIENNDKVAEFADAIGELQKQISKLETLEGNTLNAPIYQKQQKQESSFANDIFYMAGPVNNYFPNTAKSLTKENTVYKFTVKANKQEATYEIHTSGAPVNEIVNMVESYIKPACDEENLPSVSVKNIITKRPGTAILENDKWTIKTKALIRYE